MERVVCSTDLTPNSFRTPLRRLQQPSPTGAHVALAAGAVLLLTDQVDPEGVPRPGHPPRRREHPGRLRRWMRIDRPDRLRRLVSPGAAL